MTPSLADVQTLYQINTKNTAKLTLTVYYQLGGTAPNLHRPHD